MSSDALDNRESSVESIESNWVTGPGTTSNECVEVVVFRSAESPLWSWTLIAGGGLLEPPGLATARPVKPSAATDAALTTTFQFFT